MELHELKKLVYYNEDCEWVFTDDEYATCSDIYCLALYWDYHSSRWGCGYYNADDIEYSNMFVGWGKTPQEAIAHAWENIQKKEAKTE